MQSGGAARVTSIMCRCLVNEGHEVTLLTDTDHYKIRYNIPCTIDVVAFGSHKLKFKAFQSFTRKVFKICQIRFLVKEHHFDVFISVMPFQFFLAKLSTLGLSIFHIACDHTSFKRNLGWFYNLLRFRFYKYADILTILTKHDSIILGDHMPNKVVVYNPVSFKIVGSLSPRRKNVLCIGRYDAWEVKGIDRALDIWKRVYRNCQDWTLEIAGDGSKDGRAEILQMIYDKKLDNHVVLLGFVSDMQNLLSKSSIFVLTSRMEGMPMALLEAMSQGCCCISFDIGGIISEIVGEDKSAVVISDNDDLGFSIELERLINDNEKRKILGKNAIETAKKYSEDAYSRQWRDILNKAVVKNN